MSHLGGNATFCVHLRRRRRGEVEASIVFVEGVLPLHRGSTLVAGKWRHRTIEFKDRRWFRC